MKGVVTNRRPGQKRSHNLALAQAYITISISDKPHSSVSYRGLSQSSSPPHSHSGSVYVSTHRSSAAEKIWTFYNQRCIIWRFCWFFRHVSLPPVLISKETAFWRLLHPSWMACIFQAFSILGFGCVLSC